MVEQYDAIWDDGVAPEVTLDFDCQHISSGEGLAMWVVSYLFVFGGGICCLNGIIYSFNVVGWALIVLWILLGII